MPQIMQHPWLLRNLPQSRWGMNERLLQSLVPAGLQSVEEIEQLVQQATRPAQPWPVWLPTQPNMPQGERSPMPHLSQVSLCSDE